MNVILYALLVLCAFIGGFYSGIMRGNLRHIGIVRVSMPTPYLIVLATPWFYFAASSGSQVPAGFIAIQPGHAPRMTYRLWYGIRVGLGGRILKAGPGRYFVPWDYPRQDESLCWWGDPQQ
jgi:hypothetical protein